MTGLLLVLLLTLGANAAPQRPSDVAPNDPARLHNAAMLLSHYPAGMVPLEQATLHAITDLARLGERSEISLLRNIAENESTEIAEAAILAIGEIRTRQVDTQRATFAQTLPNWPDLVDGSEPYREAGLHAEEAQCASYARLLLTAPEKQSFLAVKPTGTDKDPWLLLSQGNPRAALEAVSAFEGTQARLLEARALEELGEVHEALQIYALTAAHGDNAARRALDGFGVDSERLLLGILAHSTIAESLPFPELQQLQGDEIVLDVLIRHGSHLTVAVLAERSRRDSADALKAVTALARMLDGTVRDAPLRSPSQRVARKALLLASAEGSEAVREHVAEMMNQYDSEKR